MSNQELKEALLATRKKNQQQTKSDITEFSPEEEMLLIEEKVYSNELKRRELLEWALRS